MYISLPTNKPVQLTLTSEPVLIYQRWDGTRTVECEPDDPGARARYRCEVTGVGEGATGTWDMPGVVYDALRAVIPGALLGTRVTVTKTLKAGRTNYVVTNVVPASNPASASTPNANAGVNDDALRVLAVALRTLCVELATACDHVLTVLEGMYEQ